MTEDQLNQQLAKFFGQATRHLDDRLDAMREELKADINGVRTTVDGIAQRLGDDADEQAILNNRHDDWISQLAKHTGTTLVPEQ